MNNEIKVLNGLEHIQKRPGMYIGSTDNPNHLLQEILDNAIDEAINKFADKILICVDKNSATVCDNGRGFPIHDVKLPDKSIMDSVVAATCELFSGSKFNDRAYSFSIGTHGVGLTAINALSSYLNIFIKKENKIHHYYFEKSKFIKVKIFDIDLKEIWWSTKIQFEVCSDYFESDIFEVEEILKQLIYVSSKYNKIDILFNNKPIKKISPNNYFKNIIKTKSNIFTISYTNIESNESITIYFTYCDISKEPPFGCVNLKFCGGTFMTSFATIFYNIVKTNFLNFDFITRTDIISDFKYFIDIQVKNPKYSSQDKSKMTSNVLHLMEKLKTKLVITLQDKFFKDKFEEIYNKKSDKKLSKIIKTTKSGRVSSENPLNDCKNIPGEILYILEGDSAGGTLKKVRNKITEAILPINGKIINTITNNREKVLNPKGKFKFILEALGSSENYRYKFIKLLADADPDGLHISVLLALGIWKYAPELIAQKRVSIILPPLYGAVKNNKFIPIYHKDEISNYSNIKRFKGLGEMNPSELLTIIRNPVEYIIESPITDQDKLFVEMLITDTELKRRICENPLFGFTRLFNLTKKAIDNEQSI